MKKWEYLQIGISYWDIGVEKGVYRMWGEISPPIVITKNGVWLQPIKTEKPKDKVYIRAYFPNLIDYLARLGADGWEVISIDPISQASVGYWNTFCYLKRQVDE